MEFVLSSLLVFTFLISTCRFSDSYDPMDPNGNITVTFDILQYTFDGYVARVSIQNYYQYRHVDSPGWRLGWSWAKNEVIWEMSGAFATQQGDCTAFKVRKPHCCKAVPDISDMLAEATLENRTRDCCRGGFLASRAMDPANAISAFEMTVGNLEANSSEERPVNLTFQGSGPGYTCSPVEDTDPTLSFVIEGRREEQVYIHNCDMEDPVPVLTWYHSQFNLRTTVPIGFEMDRSNFSGTWKSTCTYSSFLANKAPVCCVSLSTFYNPKLTSCPSCSCGCRRADQTRKQCISEGASSSGLISETDILRCSDHMCPLQVHWHVKSIYMDHWRVKLTISNFNFRRNYSNWNVLVQHSGFSQPTTSFSFNNMALPTSDEVVLFWGVRYYNDELIEAGEYGVGSATTDILMRKDVESFSLRHGWAFPRRVYFNGENCEMPLPDAFPDLPSAAYSMRNRPNFYVLFLFLYLMSKFESCLHPK